MFEIRRRIEQLELIAHLLGQNTPSSSRFALILADNFAEIVMYARACDEFAKDQMLLGYRPPRWSTGKRQKVERYFDSKVNFLVTDVRVIDGDDALFFKFAHTVRNRAYHTDAYQYDLIGPVARTYSGKICRLYPRVRPSAMISVRSPGESEFLERHGVSDAIGLRVDDLERICALLASKQECTASELAEALSKNLTRRIDEITGTSDRTGLLDTLLDGTDDSDSGREQVLKHIQFNASRGSRPGGVSTQDQLEGALAKWGADFAAFRAPVTLDTLGRWRATARSIAADTSPGRAAQRFRSIEHHVSPVEELIHQAVREYEKRVDSETQ